MRIGKPIATLDLIELQSWCRNQHKNARYKCDAAHRLLIGNYQVVQGLEWKNNASSDESYLAAVIHWIIVAEILKVPLEQYLHTDIFKGNVHMVGDREFIMAQSRVSQMVIYGEAGQKTKRGSTRFKKDILGENMATMINYCMYRTNTDKIKEAMQLAMEIMSGVL